MAKDFHSLVSFGPAAVDEASEGAETVRRRTGAATSMFAGIRDPVTGAADLYLTVAASVHDIEKLVPVTAVIRPDMPIRPCTYRSASTIRADVARRIYASTGRGIVWAVVDSGVDGTHPHFARHQNLLLSPPLEHQDFTMVPDGQGGTAANDSALTDEHGHGTFAAGIIAGENAQVRVAERAWNDDGRPEFEILEVPLIGGIAPECKLISLKVLDAQGQGRVSTAIKALAAIQQMNSAGLMVHGANLGLDYETDLERFACGRSPICLEAERLVRSGVVVVVAAGNTGYGTQATGMGQRKQGMEASIRDPGNAELVITVGSTDRERPQAYGVSYFSSKGPTLDGRLKPDLVAPGERIVSCAAGSRVAQLRDRYGFSDDVSYSADSGTSVAAAHVSGAAAALMSARGELRGDPVALKSLLMAAAADLGRSPFYQGRGVVDVLQALQQKLAPTAPTQLNTPMTRITPRANPSELPTPLPAPQSPRSARHASPLRVMYSYSHQDEVFKDELNAALAALRREGSIEVWQDREILPGAEFAKDIARALAASDIVVLLISKYFIASDYCWSIEMTEAVERHSAGTVVVVPVILKPTDWRTSPVGQLTALPRDGKPITEWQNPDAAWADVAEGMRRLVNARRSG